MYKILLGLLAVLCVVIIIAIVMQPTKSNAASALTGGSEDLFARRKSRGFEAFMQRATMILLVVFFALALALMYLTYKGL
ncbi:preprotein translocase subunit SecG [Carnobacteriaceae bacterium zg-ZUI252]|nr:preprotein translocase subunit SecG [Carnobacteriaceae bacterium zg-ZUI252]MBS4770082.1 preprotein translocase subunit SecG [Carnobacteriaceae bacterium zg-ZUI240]QTU82865.1 preprotein translocase subunit SecG [Carnobacteriaceae bacterium zg-C25]